MGYNYYYRRLILISIYRLYNITNIILLHTKSKTTTYKMFQHNTCIIKPYDYNYCAKWFQAAKRGLTYPKYAWIAYDWYPRGWWKQDIMENEEDCDNDMLQTFLERVISLRRYPAPDDSSVETDAGIVSKANLLANILSIL